MGTASTLVIAYSHAYVSRTASGWIPKGSITTDRLFVTDDIGASMDGHVLEALGKARVIVEDGNWSLPRTIGFF